MKKTITYKEIKDKVLDIINNGGGGGGKSKLSELNDVTITSASDGQVLKYNGSKWVNGTAGGGGFEIKSFTYTGTGSNVITFPVKPTYVLNMSTTSSGFHIRHIPFIFKDGVTAGLMIFDQSSAVGTYTIDGQTVTINGFSDAQGGLYKEGEVVTVEYI